MTTPIIVADAKAYKFTTLAGDTCNIGDAADAKFHPKITLNRWAGECWFKFAFADAAFPAAKTVFEGNKVKWATTNFELHFYPKDADADNRFGSLELEVILKVKPPSNVYAFTFNSAGLTFYRQDQEQPVGREHVVGSYAVYKTNRTKVYTNGADAEKYKAGKAFHIWRPKLTDALGASAWGDINITGNVLTLTLPQTFLDAATYPVSVDPDFGQTDIGSTQINCFNTIRILHAATSGGVGTGVSMTGRFQTSSGSDLVKMALYLHSDDGLEGGTSEVAVGARNWYTANFTAAPSIANVEYNLVAWSGGNNYIDADNVGGAGLNKSVAYNGWPDPLTGLSSDNYEYSIYCTYTASGGGDTRRIRRLLVGVGLIATIWKFNKWMQPKFWKFSTFLRKVMIKL